MVDTEVPMNATARKVIDAQRSRANSFPFGSVLQSPRPWQSPLRRPSSNDMTPPEPQLPTTGDSFYPGPMRTRAR